MVHDRSSLPRSLQLVFLEKTAAAHKMLDIRVPGLAILPSFEVFDVPVPGTLDLDLLSSTRYRVPVLVLPGLVLHVLSSTKQRTSTNKTKLASIHHHL